MAYPSIRYQRVEYNKTQARKAVVETRARRTQLTPSIHQAATIAGEFIARKNNFKDTKLKDIVNYYKPDYLEGKEVK